MQRHTKLTVTALALGLFGGAGSLQADTGLSLTLPLGPDGAVKAVDYRCGDGTELSVQYINAGANSLALIPLKGETMIYVSVISGSGVRYVSGASEWYTENGEATLSDEMSDAPSVTCNANS